MKWIALTGVNGFIGHNLVLEILAQAQKSPELQGLRVLGADLPGSIDRATHRRNLDQPGFEYCHAEDFLATLSAWQQRLGSKPLAVIHNGACSSTTETNREVFQKLNIESSQELFKYCAQQQVPFLYASSASVYGDGSLGFSDAIEKNDHYTPMNLYGQSKHNFDKWVLRQATRPSVWFGMRYFNVFGPHEEHKAGQASILHWGGKQIADTGKLRLYRSHRDDISDGEQRRDFVSVFDIVRVTLGLLKLSLSGVLLPEKGCFVNIGRGQAATWIETAEALFAAMEKPCRIEFIDMPVQLQEHYQNYTCADLLTLHELGLTEPFLSLREAFSRSLPQTHFTS